MLICVYDTANEAEILKAKITQIATLWDAVFSDITSNPFQITFADLTGITLKSGVWNASLQRLEC